MPDKAICRRNALCISRQINAARRKKARRLGVLTIFKQALSVPGNIYKEEHKHGHHGRQNCHYHRRRPGRPQRRRQLRLHRLRHCHRLCQGGGQSRHHRTEHQETGGCQGGAGAALRCEGAPHPGRRVRGIGQQGRGSKRGGRDHQGVRPHRRAY